FAVAAVPLAMGMFDKRHLRAGWGAKVGLTGCLALICLGVWATVGWMQVDMVDELRGPLREATLALGAQQAPLGAGVGAFVEVFEQGGPDTLLLPRYINHAHSEYVQWWMEAGWVGVLVVTVVIVIMGWLAV